jgi:hypothetical protein
MTEMLNTNYYYIAVLSDGEIGLLYHMPPSRRALAPLPARAHLFNQLVVEKSPNPNKYAQPRVHFACQGYEKLPHLEADLCTLCIFPSSEEDSSA